MGTPRQEFLGPITKLAATYLNGSWVPDGYGIIDGYGAEFHGVTMVLNARDTQPTTGVDKGSFWVDGSVSPTIPRFTNSNGDTIELGTGGGVPVGPENQVYWSDGIDNAWTGNPVVNGVNAANYISIGAFGAGSLTFSSYLTIPPIIQQDPINPVAVGSGQTLTISAQGNGSSPGMFGGKLQLNGGAGWHQGVVEMSGGSVYVDSQYLGFRTQDGYISQVIFQENIYQPLTPAPSLVIAAGSNSHATGIGGDLIFMAGRGASGTADGSILFQTPTGTTGVGADNLILSKESYGTVLQSVFQKIVSVNNGGYGSYTLTPTAYDQSINQRPRKDKQFGTFKLLGNTGEKTITFSTAIHGASMPTTDGYSILTGMFRIGWIGNGSYTNGCALQFPYTISSDASGNINAIYCAITDAFGTPGTTTTLLSGSAPSSTTGNSMWVVPATAHTPLFTLIIPAGPTTVWSFNFRAVYNAPFDVAKFFWENEYGWGV